MILLFSGGIDSFVAYHYLNKPQTVYFDLHTRYAEKEKLVVKKLIPSTIIDNSLNLHDREYGDKAYVPFRNLLLACQAAKYSDSIVIAGVADDQVSDKNEEIFHSFSMLLSKLENKNIVVWSPFWKFTKEKVVKWYVDNIGDDLLLETVSCYSASNEIYCGACPSCFRKWCALRANGYDLKFHNDVLMQQYYADAVNNKYIKERCLSIIREVDAYRS